MQLLKKEYLMLRLKRMFTRMFWILPLNNKKLFFSSYEGKQYSCNPRSVYEVILEKESDLIYVWEYNNKNCPDKLKKNVIIVKHNSFNYFLQLLTSRYIITNSGISASIALRKKKVCVNTWHDGGAYKKVGIAVDEKINGTKKNELEIIAKQTTYFLSSSQKFTEIMSESTLIDRDKFLNIGMPRNDVFFNKEVMQRVINETKQKLQICEKDKIVLLAPTYRGCAGNANYLTVLPKENELLEALTERFGGKWKILYRSHYYKNKENEFSNLIDVSDYPDMQELLCITDVLITDYSSSIWDFSLTYKPCFLYVPDLDEYVSERGEFYTDIMSWPGIVARNDQELHDKILEFEYGEYENKIENHHKNLKSYEKGIATKQLMYILNID